MTDESTIKMLVMVLTHVNTHGRGNKNKRQLDALFVTKSLSF